MSKYGAQGVGFLVSLVLARLLAPEHFGLLGMAMVITGFAKVFRNLGFASAIVQRKELSDALLSTLFWVNLGVCVVTGGAVAAAAPAAAWMYSDPRVTPIVAVLTLSFVFAGFTMVPSALLQREMAFKKLAVREIGGIIVNGTTSITLALLGFGVWALVWGTLAGSAAQMLLINLVQPFRPQFVWDRLGLKECLSFGLNLTGFNIFNYFSRNADNLIIGVFLGPVALGYYALAYKLMLLPRDSVSNVVTRVLFPKLSKLQGDDEKLADVYLRACGAIAFVTFPMMAGLAVLAEPFVEVVLGEKWLPAVPLIWILAPVGIVHSVLTTVGQIYLAKGRSDWMFRWGVAAGLFYVFAFFVGTPWGVTGVAASYAIANLILLFPCLHIPYRLVRTLTVKRLVLILWRHTAATGAMVVVVAGVQQVVHRMAYADPHADLALGVASGCVAYCALSLGLRPMGSNDLLAAIGLPPSLVRLVRAKA